MKIVLYASEVASLIGKNRFQTIDEAFQKVLHRNGLVPKSSEVAQLEKSVQILTQSIYNGTPDEKTSFYLKSEKFQSCLHDIKVATEKANDVGHTPPSTDPVDSYSLEELPIKVLESASQSESVAARNRDDTKKIENCDALQLHIDPTIIDDEVSKISNEPAFIGSQNGANSIETKSEVLSIDSEREEDNSGTIHLEGEEDRGVCTHLQNEIESNREVEHGESTTVTSAVDKAGSIHLKSEIEPSSVGDNTTVVADTVNLVLDQQLLLTPKVIRQAEREIVMNNGRLSEREESFITTQKSFRKDLFRIHNISFVLVGRIDGVDRSTGRLVELKTRYRMLRERCWPNEKIQMEMYLWMSGENEIMFIEKYQDKRYEEIIKRSETSISHTLAQLKIRCLDHFAPFAEEPSTKTTSHVYGKMTVPNLRKLSRKKNMPYTRYKY